MKPQSPIGNGVVYNPITNPIPNYNQNPYVMKQKMKAMSGRAASHDVEHNPGDEVREAGN